MGKWEIYINSRCHCLYIVNITFPLHNDYINVDMKAIGGGAEAVSQILFMFLVLYKYNAFLKT